MSLGGVESKLLHGIAFGSVVAFTQSGPMRVSSTHVRKPATPGLVYSLDFDSFDDARASTGANGYRIAAL